MRYRMRLGLVAGAATLCLIASVTPATAAPTSTTDDTSCSILISKADAAGESAIRSITCTPARAAAGTSRSAAPANPFAATVASSTLLAILYRDANYSGNTAYIYGDAGPCDASGYGISKAWTYPNPGVADVSSYRLYNNCNTASYWDSPWWPYSGNWSGWVAGTTVANLGAWNDRMYSMKVIHT